MSLPFFYIESFDTGSNELELDESNSRHAVSVLRMQEGEQMYVTDGKGNLLTASISDAHKKKCRIAITGIKHIKPPAAKTAIGISLVKNPVRFEWFLEKATEIGISIIYPIICARTEKQHFRHDRMKNVLVSAMLQSRQSWLPELHEPERLEKIVSGAFYQQKFIAHCIEDDKKSLTDVNDADASRLVLIGPEGDFTQDEIAVALQHGFIAVSLGETRLRTETAGMVAAVLLQTTNSKSQKLS